MASLTDALASMKNKNTQTTPVVNQRYQVQYINYSYLEESAYNFYPMSELRSWQMQSSLQEASYNRSLCAGRHQDNATKSSLVIAAGQRQNIWLIREKKSLQCSLVMCRMAMI